jgi:hypothetical protein
MKIAVLGLCLAALALGACRRETPEYTPMKLGATSGTTAGTAQAPNQH